MNNKVVIKTENLTKKYGDFTAVNNLNLEIYEGEVFGLLGPNGAGKTTTILMLLGLTEPTNGSAWINEYNTTREPILVKKIVGYLPDHIGFYEDMTGRENLRFVGRLNGLKPNEIEEKIEDFLSRVKLTEAGDQKVGTYSRGMLQRLGIADTLMKNPKVIVLDEPTLGLDPEGIKEMLELIVELARKDKKTVLISSHLLYQVQKICDRVGVFVKGSLLACGPIETLGKQVFEDQPLTMELKISPVDDTLKKAITSLDDDVVIEKKENNTVIVKSKNEIRKELIKMLSNRGYDIQYFKESGRDLDDIYGRYFAGKGVSK